MSAELGVWTEYKTRHDVPLLQDPNGPVAPRGSQPLKSQAWVESVSCRGVGWVPNSLIVKKPLVKLGGVPAGTVNAKTHTALSPNAPACDEYQTPPVPQLVGIALPETTVRPWAVQLAKPPGGGGGGPPPTVTVALAVLPLPVALLGVTLKVAVAPTLVESELPPLDGNPGPDQA